MPDHRNFSMQVQMDGNVNVARFRYSLQIVNSMTGALLNDFTGANSIDFALRVPGFTAAQHKELADFIAHKIISMKRGDE